MSPSMWDYVWDQKSKDGWIRCGQLGSQKRIEGLGIMFNTTTGDSKQGQFNGKEQMNGFAQSIYQGDYYIGMCKKGLKEG